jgi:hypothetical protein
LERHRRCSYTIHPVTEWQLKNGLLTLCGPICNVAVFSLSCKRKIEHNRWRRRELPSLRGKRPIILKITSKIFPFFNWDLKKRDWRFTLQILQFSFYPSQVRRFYCPRLVSISFNIGFVLLKKTRSFSLTQSWILTGLFFFQMSVREEDFGAQLCREIRFSCIQFDLWSW